MSLDYSSSFATDGATYVLGTVEVAGSSLMAFLERWFTLLESGAFAWDSEYSSAMPVEDELSDSALVDLLRE